MNYLGKHLANVPAPKPPTSDDYLKILNESITKTWDNALTKALEKEIESDKSMPQPLTQARDAILDALRSGVKQDMVHNAIDNQKNAELKQKYFSAKDQLLINDVKTSLYNIFSSQSPIPLRLLENAIVAGGCFASMFHSRNPNDYDIFILQGDPNDMKLKNNIINSQLEDDKEWKHDSNDGNYLQNPNIESVFSFEHNTGYHMKFQYIFTKFKTREELLNDFDFVHCCTSMTLKPNDLQLYITPTTYESIRDKVLKKNPNCNRKPKQWRIDKFLSRGWKPAYETDLL